jgi:hypothetical protein
MSVEFEVVTSTGSYIDKNGEEKKRWLKCGVIFKSEKGNYSMKLEAIPTKSSEDGMWFALFVPKPREQKPQQQGFRDKPQKATDDFDDDIPF